jgi:hypothetical protein
VIGPDSTPAAGVVVSAATPRRNVVLQDYAKAIPSAHVSVTDAHGRFELWPEDGPFVITAASDAGYAIVKQTDFSPARDIHLAPWATIAGQAQFAGKSVAGQIVNIYPAGWPFAHPGDLVQTAVIQYQSAVTDSLGRFSLSRIPAGLMSVAWSDTDSNHSSFIIGDNEETQTIALSAGQAVTVNFGDAGRATRPVTGNVRMAAPAAGLTLEGGTVTARTLESSIPANAPACSCMHSVRIEKNGAFHLPGLLPGKYQLVIGSDGIVEFTVPDIPQAMRGKPLELPAIELKPIVQSPSTQPSADQHRGLRSE